MPVRRRDRPRSFARAVESDLRPIDPGRNGGVSAQVSPDQTLGKIGYQEFGPACVEVLTPPEVIEAETDQAGEIATSNEADTN